MYCVMKKIILGIGAAIVVGIVVVNAMPTNSTNSSSSADKPTSTQEQVKAPAYAKWSKIAIQETQKKYSEANIIDYLHEGSETSGDTTVEKFKLWLKGSNKEFGVFVTIKYVTKTEEIVTIEFQETTK